MKNDDEKPNKPKLSLVKSRLIKAHTVISLEPPKEIAYQHTVLCQTILPYRNPGDQIREWQREQGNVSLLIEAGRAKDPIWKSRQSSGCPLAPRRASFCVTSIPKLSPWTVISSEHPLLLQGRKGETSASQRPGRYKAAKSRDRGREELDGLCAFFVAPFGTGSV